MSTQEARARRARLFRPPNAVPDLGIDLKRKPPQRLPESNVVSIGNVQHSHHEKEMVEAVARLNDEIIQLKVLLTENGIVARTPDKPRVTLNDIKRAVCAEFEVPILDFESRRQSAYIARTRHAAVFLAQRLTLHSVREIGLRFGGRDHSTALHSIKRAEQWIGSDPCFADQIRRLQFDLLQAANRGANA